jgi:hypothetical protein
VCLNVDVGITFECAGGKTVSELTKTLIVNAHGALILPNLAFSTGDLLRMKNLKTVEELACRVVDWSWGNTGVPEVGWGWCKAREDLLAHSVSTGGLESTRSGVED